MAATIRYIQQINIKQYSSNDEINIKGHNGNNTFKVLQSPQRVTITIHKSQQH
ncbi:putative tectonin beta-propeller repeat-containing protein [Sesbania bispinosa]|nr:putative tectonin beta-propeller repeat-containing protein [Sesbania bispinosa]